jgi:hypothetical protein
MMVTCSTPLAFWPSSARCLPPSWRWRARRGDDAMTFGARTCRWFDPVANDPQRTDAPDALAIQ